jgi:hypothetical protein
VPPTQAVEIHPTPLHRCRCAGAIREAAGGTLLFVCVHWRGLPNTSNCRHSTTSTPIMLRTSTLHCNGLGCRPGRQKPSSQRHRRSDFSLLEPWAVSGHASPGNHPPGSFDVCLSMLILCPKFVFKYKLCRGRYMSEVKVYAGELS